MTSHFKSKILVYVGLLVSVVLFIFVYFILFDFRIEPNTEKLLTSEVARSEQVSISENPACYDAECENKKPNYVVITRPMFISAIRDFVQWKIDNGFDVGVATVEYIQSKNKESNPAASVREFIKDYATNRGTKYFVFIGDTSTSRLNYAGDMEALSGFHKDIAYDLTIPWNVPTGYYCRRESYESKNPDIAKNILKCGEATDLYFADFNDSNWVENDDGHILRGIYSNSFHLEGGRWVPNSQNVNLAIDERPFVFSTIVARIPIRTQDEFRNIFNKFRSLKPTKELNYLVTEDLGDTSISSAKNTYEKECAVGYITPDEAGARSINCANNPYALSLLFPRNDSSFTYSTYKNGDEVSAIREKISNSTAMLAVVFHGSITGIWQGNQKIFSSLRKSVDPNAMLNNLDILDSAFPLWVSGSCYIGAYSKQAADEDEDALSEALLKSSKGPVIFATPTNYYFFFKEILEGKTVGEAFYNVGQTMVRYTSVHNPLLGDPSLKMVP